MKLIIIEDEMPAACRLEKLVVQIALCIIVVIKLDSIKAPVNQFNGNP